MEVEFTYWQPIYGAENSFIYILTLIIFLFAVITFIKNKFDILHPAFIFSICLAGCCSLDAIYTKLWNMPMHFNTAMFLVCMAFLFILGSNIANVTVSTGNLKIKRIHDEKKSLHIGWPLWLLFVIILSFCLYLNYMDFINAARQVTTETEFSKMLKPVVEGFAHRQIEMSRWNAYRMRFAMGVAYIAVLAVWLNGFAKQYWEVAKWSVFILLFLPFMVLTGGRQQFMYLILFAMVSFFLVYRKNCGNDNHLKKEFMIIGVSLALFLICFLGLGVVNGKIASDKTFLSVLAHYAGTNISALDVFINEMKVPDTQYIGSTTLVPIYGFLHSRGFDVPQFYQYISLFTIFKPVSTNVYTAFCRYILDFGYLGCALIVFLIGYLYTFLYKSIYKHGLKNWMILVYASIVYPIFLMGREERFLNEIMNTSKLSFCIGMIILYRIFEFFSEREEKAK